MAEQPQLTLPASYRYTIIASMKQGGVATLWDANARTFDGTFVTGASGDTPEAALEALAKEIADAE